MTLLQEIENGAASSDMSLGTLLRKCLILASRLGSKPATDWVEWELNGYPNGSIVPEYRQLNVIVKANLVDLGKQITDWVVPPTFLGKHATDFAAVSYRQGIGSIEHTLGPREGVVCLAFGDLVLFLNAQKFTHMEVTAAWGEVSSNQLANILETVRNRVLKFALDLGKEYPHAGAIKSSSVESVDRVDQIFVNNIYGTANVIGTAHKSTIGLNVCTGDFASLKHILEENGISASDIKELKEHLRAEPKASETGFGPKIADWIGKMMTKAANGSWKVATNVAGSLLVKSLERYYGLS